MNKLLLLLTVAAAISLSSCAANPNNRTLIVLQNPATKEMKDCTGGDPWGTWDIYAATEACAKAYEKAGYVRMGAY
jgi:hypothetical protein